MKNLIPKWEIKGVQLDLARQMETIDYIKHFIDFISDNGFNTLILYLEGRIKTKSFPYPKDEESYTPEDIKIIVEYAASKGIDIIPVIPNLGHTEQFLCYQELNHLAELRGKKAGRFTDAGEDFYKVTCPSLDETYEFYQAYLEEIIPLFPGKYFHTGNDETWDMGYCDLCRERLLKGETQSDIFEKHLEKTNSIIKGFGKQMLIWEDMFEHYPEALNNISRDIILCCWHYDSLIDIPKGHFSNKIEIDKFKLYDELGFEYLISTGTSYSNIESFTKYGLKYNPLGGFVTIWEKKLNFLFEHYINIAFAGRLWESFVIDKTRDVLKDAIKDVFKSSDIKLIDIMLTLQSISLEKLNSNFISRQEGAGYRQYEQNAVLLYLKEQLKEIIPSQILDETTEEIYNDMNIKLEHNILAYKIKEISKKVFENLNSESYKQNQGLVEQIHSLIQKVDKIYQNQKNVWNKQRKGLCSQDMDEYYSGIIVKLKELSDMAENKNNQNTGLLKVSYFLPDAHSAQRTNIFLKYKDNEKWVKVVDGVYKPQDLSYGSHAYYKISYPIDAHKIIEKCRIDTWGYGGQGFTYISAINKSGSYVPYSVSQIIGKIETPGNLLTNDLQWCYTGEKNVNYAFDNMGIVQAKNSIVVHFTSQE